MMEEDSESGSIQVDVNENLSNVRPLFSKDRNAEGFLGNFKEATLV